MIFKGCFKRSVLLAVTLTFSGFDGALANSAAQGGLIAKPDPKVKEALLKERDRLKSALDEIFKSGEKKMQLIQSQAAQKIQKSMKIEQETLAAIELSRTQKIQAGSKKVSEIEGKVKAAEAALEKAKSRGEFAAAQKKLNEQRALLDREKKVQEKSLAAINKEALAQVTSLKNKHASERAAIERDRLREFTLASKDLTAKASTIQKKQQEVNKKLDDFAYAEFKYRFQQDSLRRNNEQQMAQNILKCVSGGKTLAVCIQESQALVKSPSAVPSDAQIILGFNSLDQLNQFMNSCQARAGTGSAGTGSSRPTVADSAGGASQLIPPPTQKGSFVVDLVGSGGGVYR